MLTLIGLGVNGIDSISLKGADLLRKSDILYLDGYTTPMPKDFVEKLKRKVNKEVTILDRVRLEEGIECILDQANTKSVSLAVLGDPFFATTHMNFLVEAKKRNVPCKVIHNASIVSFLISSCGLHPYKFGRITTIVRESGTPATSVYFTLYDNLIKGAHTILLLEFDTKTNTGVSPLSAFKILKDAEEVYKLGAFSEDTLIIVACRAEREDEKFFVGKVCDLSEMDFGEPPYSIIIPSKLHFTEEEAIRVLYGIERSKITNNIQNLRKQIDFLVNKYVKRTKETLSEARKKLPEDKVKEFDDLFENVECYLDDSIRFLNSGDDELAMLSVGYAEGLLDSLRFQRILDLKW